MSKLGNAYDSVLGIFSPRKALQNQYLRKRLEKEKSRAEQYAAAKSNRMTGNWLPANSNINEIIGGSTANVRARVRQLVRDFPYFANAVNRIVDFTVGDGIVFQSKAKDADGKLDRKAIQKIEDVFNFWADDCDISKKLHFYEIMQLAKRQDVESGEFLIVKRLTRDKSRYLPYKLQIYEADWLTTVNDNYYGAASMQNSGANDIYQGIEYNRYTGEVIAYHFCDPNAWGDTVRIPAQDVVHGFQTLRPGQLRGITPFASGVLLANDLSDYMDAEVDAAKMAAKYLAFVKSPTLASRQLGLAVEQNADGNNQYIDDMENAIVEYLNPGEEITIASNPRPGGQITPFTKLIVSMLSIVTNIPYEILSGDYQGVNYSTLRSSRNDFCQYLKPISTRHIRQFCQKTVMPMFEYANMSGKLNLPGFAINPDNFLKCEWQPPGMQSVDPLKETKADIDAIHARLKSPQERILARGRDPEEVLKEIRQWQDWMKEYDLEEIEVSTAMQNSPSALDNQDLNADAA
jgi:lambda family phage portal protein